MKSFSGRTAAITGAGSGIGRALAQRLAAEGCHLSLSDINADGLAETMASLAASVTTTSALVDVADPAAVEAWAAETVRGHGRVDLVINNAGVAQAGSVAGSDLKDYAWVLDINLWGVIHGTKAFLPYLTAAGTGHIVNISSVFGLQAQPGVSAYNTSKYAVRGFTESLRQELDVLRCGVSATCVHPGGIDTAIVRNARISDSGSDVFGDSFMDMTTAFGKLLRTSPDDAARAILKGVERDSRRVLIGWDAHLLDLEQRLLPASYQRINAVAISIARAAAERGLIPGQQR